MTGAPSAARSSLAVSVAEVLRAPLLVAAVLEADLGAAAERALLALARANPGAVLDGAWDDRDRAVAELAALGERGPVVEVLCHSDGASSEPLSGNWPVLEVESSADVDPYALVERVLALADWTELTQGRMDRVGPRAPDASRDDLAMVTALASRTVRTMRDAGLPVDPFAVVLGVRGQPMLLAGGVFLQGPPAWHMSWGDPWSPEDRLDDLRRQVELSGAPVRAAAYVVAGAGGAVRVLAEHRADGARLEREV